MMVLVAVMEENSSIRILKKVKIILRCLDLVYKKFNVMLDTSLVTNWKFEESKLLGCGNFGIVSKI